eukprot:TRINITY_DN55_c0_g2_i12.p1 TRINITY_DN55_c0_g2~~TRINITY_DN55_c0_g2_i12.p1  ORF type:complete len:361 (-),score=173.83 TRINITY_DN55_c0_g2_i12:331-1413(-)
MMNIGGDPNDRSYRYKMPKLVAKVEGRGNGIKTRIPNCSDIASSLHRSPAVLTKFFGCELGAQSKWDDKEDSCIVNGDHMEKILQSKLCESFIPKFVLCPNCGLPETDMKVRKEKIRFQCAACGNESWADMTHKLCTFILKEGTGKKDTKGSKKEKKERKDKAADKGDKKEKKKKKSSKKQEEEDEEEIEWYTDLSAEAVEQRRLDATGGQLAELVAEIEPEPEGNTTAAPAEAAKEEEEEEEENSSSDDKAAEDDDDVQGVIDRFNSVFAGMSKQKEIVKGLDEAAPIVDGLSSEQSLELVTGLSDNVAKYSALVLKMLYEKDLLDEPAILKWHKSADPSVLAVSKATPFVEFLQQEDE